MSGMRPTTRLHLGNLEGALRLWIDLQRRDQCFFLLADLHALTTGCAGGSDHRALVREMLLDWLAAGLDPNESVIFVQSEVPTHAELTLLLAMITPVPWLERCTTYKDWMATPDVARSAGLGLLAYPVLQAADILLYRATTVPVGRDQAQHVELTRDIASRFNALFGEVFPTPVALYSETPVLKGTDGRKMSAVYGNAIYLGDTAGVLERKVAAMFTDPAKVFRGDPGHPDRCPVYGLHGCYNVSEAQAIGQDCSTGQLGCVDCKSILSKCINGALGDLRERRAALQAEPDALSDILRDGARKARAASEETLARVHEAMGLWRRSS